MARVLIIDDDLFTRETLRRVFEGEGYHVSLAENGVDGVGLFHREQTDLIITDILMPEKDGLESISELRAEVPDLPIIAISGGGKSGSLEFLQVARELGADEVMRKPLAIRRLLDIAARLIGQRRDRDSS